MATRDPGTPPPFVDVISFPMMICPDCYNEVLYRMDYERKEIIITPCCKQWPPVAFSELTQRLKTVPIKQVDRDAETMG